MWGIFLYYLWVLVFLYLSYVLLFCAYYSDKPVYKKFENRKGEKVKFPIWLYVVAVIIAFTPFFNFMCSIAVCIWMYQMSDEEEVIYKTFLFKKR